MQSSLEIEQANSPMAFYQERNPQVIQQVAAKFEEPQASNLKQSNIKITPIIQISNNKLFKFPNKPNKMPGSKVCLPFLNVKRNESMQTGLKKSFIDRNERPAIIVRDKVNSYKPSKSVRIKPSQDESFLPAFIKNYKLPPKKQKIVVPTMTSFKFRQSQIRQFLSPSALIKQYNILSHIGKGSFSVVSLAINSKDNKKYAIKTYIKFDQIETFKFQNIQRQIKNLKELSHSNIIKLHHGIQDKRKIFLVLQNGGKKSLAGILRKQKNLDEAIAKLYFRQIIAGMNHCHEKGICHRDLKLDNILVDDSGLVKIIDFGFSIDNTKNLSTFCGTPPYMAPQIVAKYLYDGKAIDIWALGVILYVMIYGNFPFKSNHQNELFRLIQQGKVLHKQETTQNLKQLINGMLKNKVSERLTIEQVTESKWLR